MKLSKKLCVTAAAGVLIYLRDQWTIPVSNETVITVAALAASYVMGQSYVDGSKIPPMDDAERQEVSDILETAGKLLRRKG